MSRDAWLMTVNANPAPAVVPVKKLKEFEVGPTAAKPEAAVVVIGFTTVIFTAPVLAIWAAVTCACSSVSETNVVVIAVPLNRTVAPDRNPVPLTVRVKSAPPATADPGVTSVIAGAGIVIVKFCAFEAPPPGVGLATVMASTPVADASAALIEACNVVSETNVVGRALPFN